MASEKVSISLPEELARRIDTLARSDDVSRSFIIQEAAVRYVAARESTERDQGRRASVDTARAGFDEIAQLWGADECAGTQYLDDVRVESLDPERAVKRRRHG